MSAPVYPAVALPSAARGGPAFLYVLPCVGEDLLKLGFSRDPLARMQSLHPRFYEFFDLERAFALQTENVRDARALELACARRLREHRAPSPLTVCAAAGGHTEWYRGAHETLRIEASALHALGHNLVPMRDWVRTRLHADAHALPDWCALLSPQELEARGQQSRATAAQRNVANVLDAYLALELDLRTCLPREVLAWHGAASLRGPHPSDC